MYKSISEFFSETVSKKTIRIFFIILSLGILFLLFIQTLNHTSLNWDGTHYLFSILSNRTFPFREQPRVSMHTIYYFPIVLWAIMGWHLDFAKSSFLLSIGYYWIYFFSLICCYLVLPKNKKNLFLFPLSQFIFGVSLGIGIPVAAILVFIMYFWAVLFILYFAKLKLFFPKALLVIISLPLMLSHEYIGILGWILVVVSLKRDFRNHKGAGSFFKILAIWYTLSALVGLYFTAFPANYRNLRFFLNSLYRLEFIFYHSGFSLLGLVSVISVINLLGLALSEKLKLAKTVMLVSSLISFIIGSYLLLNANEYLTYHVAYYGRVWAALSVPLILVAFWVGGSYKIPRYMMFSMLFSALVIISAHSIMSIHFGNYIANFQKALLTQRGYIELNSPEELQLCSEYIDVFWRDAVIVQASFAYTPDFKIRTIYGLTSAEGFNNYFQERLHNNFDFHKEYYYFDLSKYLDSVKEGDPGYKIKSSDL